MGMKKIYIVIGLVLSSLGVVAQGSVANNIERDVLFAFRASANGNDWINKWTDAQINAYPNPSPPLYGVTITGGDITSINIPSLNRVVGSLPSTIGNLTALTVLAVEGASSPDPVNDNVIGGTIPTSICSLVNLTAFKFFANNFSGPMPPEFGCLVNLQELGLYNKSNVPGNLVGPIPASWGAMTALKTLDLTHNDLVGKTWPAELASLDALETLELRSIGLTTTDFANILGVVKNCASLKKLLVTGNHITGLPDDFANLLTLEWCEISGQNSPMDYTDMLELAQNPSIKHFFAKSCGLTGVPANIASSNTLIELDLGYNNINPIPDVLASMPVLQNLYLDVNGITGTPNPLIGNISTLWHLSLHGNQITALPSNWQNLQQLRALIVSSNQLTGPPPSWISNLADLDYLDLSGNQLTSPLPDLTAQQPNTIRLHNNNFTGDFPFYPSLRHITIFNNHFSGFPSFISIPSGLLMMIENNNLDFGDLEPNFLAPNVMNGFSTSYNPQGIIGNPVTHYLIEGANFTLPYPSAGGAHSEYKWQKNISGTWTDVRPYDVNPNYSLTPVTLSHAGDYRVVSRNSWMTNPEVILTSATYTIVLVAPMCATPIPNIPGQFKMDRLSGSIAYHRNDCTNPVTVSCTVGPTQGQGKVVSSTATLFEENWPTDHFSDSYAGFAHPNANDFEKAKRGKWKVKSTHTYNTALSPVAKNYNSGTFSYHPFNWKPANGGVSRKWIPGATVELYSPHGEPLQESNALKIKSSAKFGYNNSVPYLTAKNADYSLVLFESFEVEYGVESRIFEDMLVITGSGTISTQAHAGKSSINLASGGDLKLKTFDFKSAVAARPMSIKFWIKTAPAEYSQLAQILTVRIENPAVPSVTVATFPVTVVARTGEWTLCESKLDNFGGLSAFVPIINVNLAQSVNIDDIRVQPMDSEMNAYVYDPQNLRLLAVFDDQHFGLYFQYSAEGKLVRKLMETVRGIKTVTEAQYNTPLVSK